MNLFVEAHKSVTEQMILNVRIANYDPTKTTSLRNRFAGELDKRIKLALNDIIKELILVNWYDASPMQVNAWNPFDKVGVFMQWVKKVVRYRILGMNSDLDVVENAWSNQYVRDAYKKGVVRARQELKKAGYSVPSVEMSGGAAGILMQAQHIKNLSLLYSGTYNELKLIAQNVETEVGRIINNGVLLKRQSVEMAKEIRGNVKTSKGLTMVRTNVVKVHHTANMQEYNDWNLEFGEVVGEFTTMGDDKVCSRCSELSGTIIAVDEASDIIPVHPNCRCFLKPIKIKL